MTRPDSAVALRDEQCENPKHVPAGGSQVPILGGGSVLAPTWPCTDIKKHP